MALGNFAIEQIFDSLWEKWPNKEGEASARKAVTVYFKSDGSKEELLRACDAYILDNIQQDPSYIYKLSNFINQDHWRDSLERGSYDRLKNKEKLAIELMEAWNSACRPHWSKITDFRARLAIAMAAINDSYFSENWKKALTKAGKVFKFEHREADPRSKIILSFSWFTNINPKKHTVLKLIENEYGQAQDDPSGTPKLVKMNPNPVSQEERDKALMEWKALIKGTELDVKPKTKRPFRSFSKPDPKVKEALEKFADALGVHIEKQDQDSDIIDIL